MRDKIEAYIEEPFWKAPNTPQTRDLKEEILGNTLEKYEDLLAGGMDEDSAYHSAISGIGDVDELIKEYSEDCGEIVEVKSTPIAVVEPEEEKKPKTSLHRIVTLIMWCLIFVIYLIISITTSAWMFTWVTFLIGFALKFVIDGIFEIHNSKQ